mgnify:CR=1 FL=1
MATVFDVAKYILEKQGSMSTWKLQKLCYYSQAWSLAWTGNPLFNEEFQAWRNGPVCPELFHVHKGMFLVDADLLSFANSRALSADEKETVDIVLSNYGDKEPYVLRAMTHAEKPWKDMRVGLGDFDSCDKVITKTSMGEYYGSL